MKKITAVLILVALLMAVTGVVMAGEKEKATDNVPNLVGHWHGKSMMHTKKDGFKKGQVVSKFIVEKQEGRVFSGKKIWVSNGTEMTENFSGVVTICNKKIYLAEHEDGMVIGDIISKDKIVIYYMESGPEAKVIMTELDRVKKK